MKLTIRTKDIVLDSKLRQYVEEKFGSLDKYDSKMIDGFVELEKTTNHHKHGFVYRCVVDLRLPHRILRGEKDQMDVKAAIDETKDELKKQIITYKEEHDAKMKRGGRLMKKLRSMAPEALFPVEQISGARLLNEGN